MKKTTILNDFQWQDMEYNITVEYNPFRSGTYFDLPEYAELQTVTIEGLSDEETMTLLANDGFAESVLDTAIDQDESGNAYNDDYNDDTDYIDGDDEFDDLDF